MTRMPVLVLIGLVTNQGALAADTADVSAPSAQAQAAQLLQPTRVSSTLPAVIVEARIHHDTFRGDAQTQAALLLNGRTSTPASPPQNETRQSAVASPDAQAQAQRILRASTVSPLEASGKPTVHVARHR